MRGSKRQLHQGGRTTLQPVQQKRVAGGEDHCEARVRLHTHARGNKQASALTVRQLLLLRDEDKELEKCQQWFLVLPLAEGVRLVDDDDRPRIA